MDMFRRARLKLTAWYLCIITLVSVCFSLAIYHVLSNELMRIERVQRLRIERRLIAPRPYLDPQLIEETKNRLIATLVVINLAILAGSALAGFLLAGRTLEPIANMVSEQHRFVSDASHELRTPLTSLIAETEVYLRGTKQTVAQAKKILTSNLEEARKLQLLSDRLIRLAQYGQADTALAFQKVLLRSLVAEAITTVDTSAKKKKITVRQHVPDLTLKGNRQALTELFVILLDNAIKYSPEHSAVDVSAKRTDGRVLIRVTDRGMGIDPKDLPHIFDRFYRADTSRTKSDAAGYGLGLSIAKQIVSRHRGAIRVQSKPNQGSVFSVGLPADIS